MFELLATDPHSRARRGRLRLPHGVVETPVFMPVGTQATVKTTTPRELEEIGASIILSNTYHMLIRPGMDVIRKIGGLHRFMAWERPLLTDSGGFQVFSLAKLARMTEDGVHFQSHVDGTSYFLGPREAVELQRELGSDIMMAFDECPPWPCDRDRMAGAVGRTLRWAEDCRRVHAELPDGPTPGQLLFGIVQGGSHADMRRECAEALVSMDFPGYAIGGVSVGEPEPEMLAAVEAAEPWLPAHKPRYAMGLGQPNQLVEMVRRGVDMFDCVLPTRIARNGTAYTRWGTTNLKSAPYKDDPGPIEEGCSCPACRTFSRAYIRHLLKSEEILGLRLVSLHNLHFYLGLMAEMRAHLEAGSFREWADQFLANYPKSTENQHDEHV